MGVQGRLGSPPSRMKSTPCIGIKPRRAGFSGFSEVGVGVLPARSNWKGDPLCNSI
jgi:hypothetical protein